MCLPRCIKRRIGVVYRPELDVTETNMQFLELILYPKIIKCLQKRQAKTSMGAYDVEHGLKQTQ